MPSQFVSKQFKIHNLKLKEVKTLQELTRPNIWKLKPYSSARDEYKGVTASVFLDANENPYNTPHNRYPDPMQCELKTLLSKIKKVSPEHIFLGNGSDEAIDLVFRAFCEPGKDNVVAIDREMHQLGRTLHLWQRKIFPRQDQPCGILQRGQLSLRLIGFQSISFPSRS